jgi:orotate phosphoribosyltransferase
MSVGSSGYDPNGRDSDGSINHEDGILSPDAVMAEFRDAGALLEGHFILTSGRRSPFYMQCARVMQDPARAGRLVGAIAENVRQMAPTVIVAPAMGGIIVGYELARQIGVNSIFLERVEGSFTLRRGFALGPQDRVVIAEDVITTGLSTRECIEVCKREGASVVGVTCLIDRSKGNHGIEVPVVSLAEFDFPTYPPHDLPPELEAIKAVKPGSRSLSSR